MFTPMIPLVFSLAFLISFFSALIFASKKLDIKSFSITPIAAVDITPTPPSLATAAANPDNDIPTPIPPWIMGRLIVKLPIFNSFILIPPIHYFYYSHIHHQSI